MGDKNHKKKTKKVKSINNIWNLDDFRMYAVGRFKPFAYIKYFVRCLRYSKQRITRGYAETDLWEMYNFLNTLIPEMLQDLKDNRNGSPCRLGEDYVNEEGILVNDTCHEKWDEVLDRMIYLWREADEITCTMSNPYKEEYTKASNQFEEKYGLFGESLCTSEEMEHYEKTGLKTLHMMSELPEYADVSDKYMDENRKRDEFRKRCKDEAFDMLKEYFYDLWD